MGTLLLFTAKVLAGLSIGLLLGLYLFGILSGCSFGMYGFSGFDAPLQLRIPGCLLNITVGQSYLYLFLLFLTAGILYGAFSMFLSQILGNRSAATAIMVMGLFLSMLNVPEKLGEFPKSGAISRGRTSAPGRLRSTGWFSSSEKTLTIYRQRQFSGCLRPLHS